MAVGVCDFCHEGEPRATYLCRKFMVTVGWAENPYIDDGIWGACSACIELIEAGKQAELIARTVASRTMSHREVPLNIHIEAGQKIIGRFWEKRLGDRVDTVDRRAAFVERQGRLGLRLDQSSMLGHPRNN